MLGLFQELVGSFDKTMGWYQKVVGSLEIYGLLFYKKVGSFPGMVAAGFMDRSVRFINWSLRLKNGGFVGRSARIRGKQCADSMCESTITNADLISDCKRGSTITMADLISISRNAYWKIWVVRRGAAIVDLHPVAGQV